MLPKAILVPPSVKHFVKHLYALAPPCCFHDADIAPDFGYDSKAVNKWLTSFGVPASTARNWTKDKVAEVKAKRDAEVLRLDAEGKSSREIEEATGIGYKTAQRVVDEAGTKRPLDKTSQEETHDYQKSPEAYSFDEDASRTAPL